VIASPELGPRPGDAGVPTPKPMVDPRVYRAAAPRELAVIRGIADYVARL